MKPSQAMAVAYKQAEQREPLPLPVLLTVFEELDKLYLTAPLEFEYELRVPQPKETGISKSDLRSLFGMWQQQQAEARATCDPWLHFIRELAGNRKTPDFSFRCFEAMGQWKTSEAHIRAAVKELLETFSIFTLTTRLNPSQTTEPSPQPWNR
jgi:hypothetical protein